MITFDFRNWNVPHARKELSKYLDHPVSKFLTQILLKIMELEAQSIYNKLKLISPLKMTIQLFLPVAQTKFPPLKQEFLKLIITIMLHI